MRTARFCLLLFALLSANVLAQSENASLGMVRAAGVAFRHFSDPTLSPESVRANKPHAVDGLHRHTLVITETDNDYNVKFLFRWPPVDRRGKSKAERQMLDLMEQSARLSSGQLGIGFVAADDKSLKGVVVTRQYRIDKQDFQIQEARQQVYDGKQVKPEARLPRPKAIVDLPTLQPFLRALAMASLDFSNRPASPREAVAMRDYEIFVDDHAEQDRAAYCFFEDPPAWCASKAFFFDPNYYQVAFCRKGFVKLEDCALYSVNKQDFSVRDAMMRSR